MNPNATATPHARAYTRVTATRRGTTNSPLTKHCARALPIVPACSWSTLASHVPSYHDAANGPSKPWGQGIAVASATPSKRPHTFPRQHTRTVSAANAAAFLPPRPCVSETDRQTSKERSHCAIRQCFSLFAPNPNPKTHLEKLLRVPHAHFSRLFEQQPDVAMVTRVARSAAPDVVEGSLALACGAIQVCMDVAN